MNEQAVAQVEPASFSSDQLSTTLTLPSLPSFSALAREFWGNLPDWLLKGLSGIGPDTHDDGRGWGK
jgi:hypothetical protein